MYCASNYRFILIREEEIASREGSLQSFMKSRRQG